MEMQPAPAAPVAPVVREGGMGWGRIVLLILLVVVLTAGVTVWVMTGCVSAYVVNYRAVPLSDHVCMTAEAGYGVDRPGRVSTIVERDGDRITAVRVGGPAVTVLDGAIETGIRR